MKNMEFIIKEIENKKEKEKIIKRNLE